MKRVATLISLPLLTLVGLVAASRSPSAGRAQASPTKLTVWVGWSAGKELVTVQEGGGRVRQGSTPT